MEKTQSMNDGFRSERKSKFLSRSGSNAVWALFLVMCVWAGEANVFAAEPVESNLTIHGYLTQAYANSSGGQILGIPTDGTTDYRTAALQFRYRMSPQDSFVLQLSHERLGVSPLQALRGDVKMDWIFYQHQLLESLYVKVGKIPIPAGIYNEILDVGTLLPFYRPATQFYGEVAFSAETVDGIDLYHSMSLGNGWELQTDVYAGEWDFVYVVDGVITPVRSKSGLGFQFWLQTPVEGLRVGVGGNRTTDHGVPIIAPGEKQYQKDLHASLDADFERFLVQAEYRKSESRNHVFVDYYGLVGIKLVGKLSVNAMVEVANLDLPTTVVPGLDFNDIKLHKDYAVGLNYKFRPDVVVKLEQHWLKTLNTEDPIVPIFMDPIKASYYIISLSTSF